MRLPGSSIFWPALVFGLAASAGAQTASPAAPAAKAETLISSPTPPSEEAEGLIKLDVVVTDKAGKPVIGLRRSDFDLLDNGQHSKILSLRAFDGMSKSPAPPVEMILVIDTLGLQYDLANHERQEVERVLRQNGGHLPLPVSHPQLATGES